MNDDTIDYTMCSIGFKSRSCASITDLQCPFYKLVIYGLCSVPMSHILITWLRAILQVVLAIYAIWHALNFELNLCIHNHSI